jgi:hypothetical protein
MLFCPYKAFLEGDKRGVEVKDRQALIDQINSYGLVKATEDNIKVYKYGIQHEGVGSHMVTVNLLTVGFTDGLL